MKVFKYQLNSPFYGAETKVQMPIGATVLSAQMQKDVVSIWALVDETTNKFDNRTFCVYGTGWSMPEEPGLYVGTVQTSDGSLVFHVFEQPRTPCAR